MPRFILLMLLCLAALGCNAGDQLDEIMDAADPERRPIDVARTGVNAFANEPQFGSVCQQYREIREVLGLRFVRVLFGWNDAVQPSPDAEPAWGFYDEIVRCLPADVDALVVVAGLPSWMSSPAVWQEGNPRTAFVERWFRRVLRRYGGESRIIGWQVWNEPNMAANPENVLLGISADPALYVEMLGRAYSLAKDIAPGKLVLNAATTAIAQDYPASLDYNEAMQAAGAAAFVDVWAIHYYGQQFENVLRGAGDFLNGLGRPIWITESGARGANAQLAYVEETWPYLRERVPAIDRIYYYSFTSAEAGGYGLRTPDPAAPYSDLYIYLRDRPS